VKTFAAGLLFTALNSAAPSSHPGWVQPLGFAAAFCTTAAFLPQLLRVIKYKSARDISLGTFLLFSAGVAMWLIYGLYTNSGPVIASNFFTLILSLTILYLKLKYDRRASLHTERDEESKT